MSKQYLFISIHDYGQCKAIGAVMIEVPEGVNAKGPFDIRADLTDAEGEDVKAMQSGVFLTREMMNALNYRSTKQSKIQSLTGAETHSA